jgi:acyl-CoA thioester hydrolase
MITNASARRSVAKHEFDYIDTVRDYECDMQGVVNNAVYSNYLEHARHMFLRDKGYEFSTLVLNGIDIFLSSIEIFYLKPLLGGEKFLVRLIAEKQGLKLIFRGEIFRVKDSVLCVRSVAKVVAVKDGQLTRGDFFEELLAR